MKLIECKWSVAGVSNYYLIKKIKQNEANFDGRLANYSL
jgi:hypothetical protein